MVKGLDVFRTWFAEFRDQYILIGGTAASLAMENAGLEFRATKDLDIVLPVEALTATFGAAFWTFVETAGYEVRQTGGTGKPAFYRFQEPRNNSFPAMVELFARSPAALRPMQTGRLTPIPFDEAVSSLSAILLDEEYYTFIMEGRREQDGLPCVGEDRLIPLKAIAWLELSASKERGEQVDAKNIRKHANDVLRLSQLFAPTTRVPVEGKIARDMDRFLHAVRSDASLDPRSLGLGRTSLAQALARVAQAYGLG